MSFCCAHFLTESLIFLVCRQKDRVLIHGKFFFLVSSIKMKLYCQQSGRSMWRNINIVVSLRNDESWILIELAVVGSLSIIFHRCRQMKSLEDDVYSFGFILLESIVGPTVSTRREAFLQNEMVSTEYPF